MYLIPTNHLPRPISFFAGTSGNNDGKHMVNAHVAQTDYYVTPPVGHKWHIHRGIFSIVDDTAFEIEEFGAQTALGGGAYLIVSRWDADKGSADEQTLNALMPIKDNGDFGHIMFDVLWQRFAATSSEQLVARWNFDQMGAPLVMNYLDKLIVRFQAGDTTAGCTDVTCCFQGVDLAYAE